MEVTKTRTKGTSRSRWRKKGAMGKRNMCHTRKARRLICIRNAAVKLVAIRAPDGKVGPGPATPRTLFTSIKATECGNHISDNEIWAETGSPTYIIRESSQLCECVDEGASLSPAPPPPPPVFSAVEVPSGRYDPCPSADGRIPMRSPTAAELP